MKKAIQKRFLSFLGRPCAVPFILFLLGVTLNSSLLILSAFISTPTEYDIPVIPPTTGACDDNLAGKCFHDTLTTPPIDVVYTWVNGSDPIQIKALKKIKKILLHGDNEIEKPICNRTQDPKRDDCIVDDAQSNRYVDNQELRYSLRSVENYLPWVRHVYLVTNGQIPYWLNLSHPRLTVVSHSQIFPNKTHLPTFSSPAIETHLHRIPGLSRYWIYLNDDVMFGTPIWPDDFRTIGSGQKVFLAWPVPDCAEGCFSNWIGDGTCDMLCNNTDCDYDGGDCLGVTSPHDGGSFSPRWWETSTSFRPPTTQCAYNCPDLWVGDKYCDKACKTKECSFDGGDCGMEIIETGLYQLQINSSTDLSKPLVVQEPAIYINYTGLIHSQITDALHNNSHLVRTAILKQSAKSLILSFFTLNHTESVVFVVSYADPNDPAIEKVINVTVTVFRNQTNTTTKPAKLPKNLTLSEEGPRMTVTPSVPVPVISDLTKRFILDSQELMNMQWNRVEFVDETNMTDLEARMSKMEIDPDIKVAILSQITGRDYSIPGYDPKPLNQSFLDELKEGSLLEELASDPANIQKRSVMDFYGDSLKFSNKLMNKEFGAAARRVPAHMPHFIDSEIMLTLQNTWPKEYNDTSSHQLRSPKDIQFAFAYFYFMMHQKVPFDFDKIWKTEMDKDGDGKLNEIELRSILAQIAGGPLRTYYVTRQKWLNCTLPQPNETETVANQTLTNVTQERPMDLRERRDTSKLTAPRSNNLRTPRSPRSPFGTAGEGVFVPSPASPTSPTATTPGSPSPAFSRLKVSTVPTPISYPPFESYPPLTKEVLLGCQAVFPIIKKFYSKKLKNKFDIYDTEDVAFRMIGSNATTIAATLDEIRARKYKFICLNDNMNHDLNETHKVVEALRDFYVSMFPLKSSFELDPEQQNPFLYIDFYRSTKKIEEVLNANEGTARLISIGFFVALVLLYAYCILPQTKRRKDQVSLPTHYRND